MTEVKKENLFFFGFDFDKKHQIKNNKIFVYELIKKAFKNCYFAQNLKKFGKNWIEINKFSLKGVSFPLNSRSSFVGSDASTDNLGKWINLYLIFELRT